MHHLSKKYEFRCLSYSLRSDFGTVIPKLFRNGKGLRILWDSEAGIFMELFHKYRKRKRVIK